MIITPGSNIVFLTPPGIAGSATNPPQLIKRDAYYTRDPEDPCGSYVCVNLQPYFGATISRYGIYRSIIGFAAPILTPAALNGKTLDISINYGPTQSIIFNGTPTIARINSVITGAEAVLSNQNPLNFIFRIDLIISPGVIQILGGTALVDLGLTVRTISKGSEAVLLKTVTANPNDDTDGVEVCDADGAIDDCYRFTTFNLAGAESQPSTYVSSQDTTGRLCLIYGTVSSVQGKRVPDALITVRTIGYAQSVSPSVFIDKEVRQVYSNSDGSFEVLVLQGALVEVNIDAVPLNRKITVPSVPKAALTSILVDRDYRYRLEVE